MREFIFFSSDKFQLIGKIPFQKRSPAVEMVHELQFCVFVYLFLLYTQALDMSYSTI